MTISSFAPAVVLSSLALLVAVPAHAQQALQPAQSSIQFTAKQMGVPLEGHFKKFGAQIAFDPAKLVA